VPHGVGAARGGDAGVKAFLIKVIPPSLILFVGLAAWEIAVRASEMPVYILPGPVAIVQALVTDWSTLYPSLLVTLAITAGALTAATVLGVAIAVLFAQSKWIELSFFPYAVILQVTPVVAIAPLIIIWVKHPLTALVVCATIVALFPIISNTILGLRSVNPGLVNLFRMNKASRWQTLVKLRIPSAAPYFFGGLRISSGLALIGAVVAEFVAGTGGTSAGLAYQILQAGYQINIPRLFAALLLITVTGVALFLLMVLLSKLALGDWHESEVTQET
jgi:NitT/TauT family transport system permease protein